MISVGTKSKNTTASLSNTAEIGLIEVSAHHRMREHEDEGHEHRGDVAQDAEVAWLFHQSFTLKTFMKTKDARMTMISVSSAMVEA